MWWAREKDPSGYGNTASCPGKVPLCYQEVTGPLLAALPSWEGAGLLGQAIGAGVGRAVRARMLGSGTGINNTDIYSKREGH